MGAESSHGFVRGVAIRTVRMGPMREVECATVAAGSGIEGDLHVSRKRGVTFIAREQWQEVIDELGAELPWHTRRANVLVETLRLQDTVGKIITIGDVDVLIHGETDPCPAMDRLHAGLQAALVPDMRGGVYGEVLRGGTFCVGDAIAVSG